MSAAGDSRAGFSARGLRCRYPGGRWILDGLDLAVRPGECVAVSGGNGAGKSSLLSVAAGIIPRFFPGEVEGSCSFDGAPSEDQRPACLRQDPDQQVLCDSVRQELGFFCEHGRAGSPVSPWELARRMGLEGLLDRPVQELSGGEKQRFALASSLAFSDGRLLILDEPTAFLDDDGRSRLAEVLARSKASGACLLLAGHEFAGLESLIDRTISLGLAAKPDFGPPARASSVGPVLLSAEGLCAAAHGKSVFSGLSLELRAGETAGFCGPNGSGKSTLARLLAGVDAAAGGRILLSGRSALQEELWRAVALAGQTPFHGLLHATLADCLRAAEALASGQPVLTARQGAESLGLDGLLGRDPQTLSFGEAQKAAILCAALCAPEVLVVDEPLLDLDSRSLGGLRRLCAAMNEAGKAVLLISHVPGVLKSLCGGPVLSWESASCAMTPAA